jgi:hypothetical protein
MSDCCKSTPFQNELEKIMEKANLDTFNKDVLNVLYCIQAIQMTAGREAADELRKQITGFILDETYPDWQ